MGDKIFDWHFKFSCTFTINEGNVKYIFHRLLEPSSWAGFGLVMAAINHINAVGLDEMAIGQLVTALVAVFLPSKKLVDKPIEETEYPTQPRKAIDRE